jgi:tubulin beta
MFNSNNFLTTASINQGRTLTGAAIFRGKGCSTAAVEKGLAKISSKHSGHFVEWIPNRLLTTISEVNSSFLPQSFSGGLIANSTCVATPFKRTLEQFGKMFKRKAYMHSYLAEGMDESEFTEAEANLQDIVAEYQ